MALLSIALLAPHPATVTLGGRGFGYWTASRMPGSEPASASLAAAE